MINPAAGKADPANRSWRSVLCSYRDGRATLAEVFKEQRRHMPAWTDLMPFLAKHGLSVDRLALINVAWCATAGNNHPPDMLRRCWKKHTAQWLAEIAPEVITFSGTATYDFQSDVGQLLPRVRRIRTFHYAHRKPDAQRAIARAVEIRHELGL